MPCKSCGGNKKVSAPQVVSEPAKQNNQLVDGDMVLVTYENPNRGQHKVVGASTHINYGYRFGGGIEKFYVHKSDIASYPEWFIPFSPPSVIVEQQEIVPPPPPPVIEETIPIPDLDFIETKPAGTDVVQAVPMDKPFDLQSIPGVTEKISEALSALGVKEWQDIVDLGIDGLKGIDGVGDKRAESILITAQKRANA